MGHTNNRGGYCNRRRRVMGHTFSDAMSTPNVNLISNVTSSLHTRERRGAATPRLTHRETQGGGNVV